MKSLSLLPLIILFPWISSSFFAAGSPKGCNISSNPGVTNVHIIPHTHLDVGWLKTIDQYFWGTKSSYVSASVQNIIDSVIEALESNKKRRFMFVETAFLWKWWQHRTKSWHRRFRKLVTKGQIELVSGGWVMNDEACTHYRAIIDQFTWGHRRLEQMMGPDWTPPKVAWQIDPFGHSREQASIINRMGFDGFFLHRIDFRDYEQRDRESNLEFIWKTSDDLKSSELFTSVLKNYMPPSDQFIFEDKGYVRNVVVDDPESEEYNLDDYVSSFYGLIRGRNRVGKEKRNLLMTFGADFDYQIAHSTFGNIDRLIKGVRKQQVGYDLRVNVFYSTPSCYLSAVHAESKAFKTKGDDFFPYLSWHGAVWTGYYTSRPALKLYERVSNQLLQSCKKWQVFAQLTDKRNSEKVAKLKEAVAAMQHHDAISGTQQQHVAEDYALGLAKGSAACLEVVSEAVGRILVKHDRANIIMCPLLNESYCPELQSNLKFLVLLDNSLVWTQENYFLRLPWNNHLAKVIGPTGDSLPYRIIPRLESFSGLHERSKSWTNDLVIKVPKVRGFSLTGVSVERITEERAEVTQETLSLTGFEAQAKSFTVTFDAFGFIDTINFEHGSLRLNQDFMSYNKPEDYKSGAYVFLATRPATQILDSPTATYYTTEFYTEVQQNITPWISQITRVYPDSDLIEFNFRVGPVPLEDEGERNEIITRYSLDIDNKGVFYTDSNGRQIMERTRKLGEMYSANYYPVTSRIFIQDKENDLQMTVFTDRSQGGSSLKDGQIELLIHRRTSTDENLGVNEPLSEDTRSGGLIHGRHYLLVSSIEESLNNREIAIKLHQPPLPYFLLPGPRDPPLSGFTLDLATQNLPPNINLLTLEAWKDGSTLIRLEHIYQASDATIKALPVTVDLSKLFVNFKVHSALEMTLSASQPLAKSSRLMWRSETGTSGRWPPQEVDEVGSIFEVTLRPFEIRTFLLNLPSNFTLN